ncbi:MAG: hypothetical protein HC842_01970 [Cytophagales bacterium]|nr:hypothetical protein [Cytophagales bacterium]
MKATLRHSILLFSLAVALVAASGQAYAPAVLSAPVVAQETEHQQDQEPEQAQLWVWQAVVTVSQVLPAVFDWVLAWSPLQVAIPDLFRPYSLSPFFHSFFETLFRLIISPNAP